MTGKRFSLEIFDAVKQKIENHKRTNNVSVIEEFQDRFQGPRNDVLNLESTGR